MRSAKSNLLNISARFDGPLYNSHFTYTLIVRTFNLLHSHDYANAFSKYLTFLLRDYLERRKHRSIRWELFFTTKNHRRKYSRLVRNLHKTRVACQMKNAKGKTFVKFTLTNSEIIPTFTEPLWSNICTKITYKNEQGTAPGQPPTALKSKKTSRTLKFIRCVGRMLDKRLYFNVAISFSFSPFYSK